MSVLLINTDSPITREARNNINENWKRIVDGFTNIQFQINHITDGRDIKDLLDKMEKALADSTTTTQTMKVLIDECKGKLNEIQISINNANTAISSANTATNNANDAVTNANAATSNANNATSNANTATNSANIASASANVATTNANNATNNAITATSNANTATNNANNAATNATNATNHMLVVLQGELSKIQYILDSIVHKGNYDVSVSYVKNNEVLFAGSTFRAKQNVYGIDPPTDVSSNDHWQLVARRGTDAIQERHLMKMWRGINPPEDITELWWYDPTYVEGRFVYVENGDVPPQDISDIWFVKKPAQ